MNIDHLNLLNKGVEIWNSWRKKHPNVKPDLSFCDLKRIQIPYIDLRYSIMTHCDLSQSDMSNANLSGAIFWNSNLQKCNLTNSILDRTDFTGANLYQANLSSTSVSKASWIGTNLLAVLTDNKSLNSLDFKYAFTDKSYPKPIRTSRLRNNFLKTGNANITMMSQAIDSLHSHKIIQKPTIFISYSRHDSDFVETFYDYLTTSGFLCWYDKFATISLSEIESDLEDAIDFYDFVILVLSRYSIDSIWVEYEINMALQKESVIKEIVLVPISLEQLDLVSNWNPFGKHLGYDINNFISSSRDVFDFSEWKNHNLFNTICSKLVRDLLKKTPINEPFKKM